TSSKAATRGCNRRANAWRWRGPSTTRPWESASARLCSRSRNTRFCELAPVSRRAYAPASLMRSTVMHFELKHTFDASLDEVIEGMTDPAFPDYMKQHMKLMTDIKPVDRKEEGGKLNWRLRCVPVPMIKKVGPKEIPPESLAFIQESQLDRAAKRLSFKNVAEHPPVLKHLENSGAMTFRDLGGRTERTTTGELKVTNLPFLLRPLGILAEKIIYSNAQDLLNEQANVFTEFLKHRKSA